MPFVPKHIYVAGPLTGSPDQPLLSNISNAFAAAHALLDAGHFPFVPHLYYYMDLGHRRPREDWLELDLAWLSMCDILLRLEGHSEGRDLEVLEARRLFIPIFSSVDAILDADKDGNLR